MASVRALANQPHGVDIRLPIRRLHDLRRRQDDLAHVIAEGQRDAVAHGRLALVQFALHHIAVAREDVAAIEADDEQLRLLGAKHETLPKLLVRQRLDERVERIVDLDIRCSKFKTAVS